MLPSIPKSGTMGSDAINLDLAVLTAVPVGENGGSANDATIASPPQSRARGGVG